MKDIEPALQKSIYRHKLIITLSIMSLLLIVLEMMLLPWEEVYISIKELFTSSLSLLGIMCVIVSVITAILSTISTIVIEIKLKKEKDRLDAMISYIRLMNSDNMLEKTLNAELLMHKEYAYLEELCRLTKNNCQEMTHDNVETAIDNAKDALIKLENIS